MRLGRLTQLCIVFFVLFFAACGDDDASKPQGTEWDVGTSDMDDMATQSDMTTENDVGGGDDVGPDMPIQNDASECGNGNVEAGEACDDGNTSDDDDCLTDCTLACGDGVVNSSEICDTGIAAGEVGACPTTCDDMDACTTDTLQGTGCQVECVQGAITACVADDGCCATGCDANTDNDCDPVCGNDVIEMGETCDPVAGCPTACDDGDVCTTDTLTGDASTCDAVCSYPAITTCINADGCCAPGCDANNDDDCMPVCGNNVIEAGESCDPVGSCPTACDDSDACTMNVLVGDAALCTAQCTYPAITMCVNADGCCPSNCNALNDSDCSASCGNGVVEGTETCDPAATCPTACDDGNVCTTNVLTGSAANCNAECTYPAITMCVNADGCCPTGCDSNNDTDCTAVCGNGVVEGSEICDGSCPAACDDADACTTNTLTGSAATCDAVCSYPAITTCTDGDGCCATGCNANTDNDCSAVCGNSVTEPGEDCDDGNAIPGDGCDMCAFSAAAPTAFLLSDIDLRDPHVFTSFLGCRDITNTVLGQPGVNPQFETAIQGDAGGDGLLDLSLLTVFRPLNQTGGATGTVDFVEGDCTAPFASTSCSPTTGASVVSFTYTNQTSGTCLGTVTGTTRASYTPAIATPSAPCFSTDPQTVSLDLSGIIITLNETQFGATYVGNPATSLSNGLIRGFLTQAQAEAITLPASLPLVGGDTLASVLRGYPTNCQGGSDMDTHPTLGAGWWMYLNFPAVQVPFTP